MGGFNVWMKERIALSGLGPFSRVEILNPLMEAGHWLKERRNALHFGTRGDLYEFRAVCDYTQSFRRYYDVLATSGWFCSQVATKFL